MSNMQKDSHCDFMLQIAPAFYMLYSNLHSMNMLYFFTPTSTTGIQFINHKLMLNVI